MQPSNSSPMSCHLCTLTVSTSRHHAPPPDYQFILSLTDCCNFAEITSSEGCGQPTCPTTQLNSIVVLSDARHVDVMMETCPTNCLLQSYSRSPQVVQHTQVLHLATTHNFPSTITFVITLCAHFCRSVKSATNLVFICLSQVLSSPNEIYSWSLQGVHNRSGTDLCHTSNQSSLLSMV
jgi:hypothetical protein